MLTAMAQQTPPHPNQAPSTQSPSSQAPSGQPQPNQAPANQIDSARTPSNERSLTEFWTPERLREARPMPAPQVDPNEVKK